MQICDITHISSVKNVTHFKFYGRKQTKKPQPKLRFNP
ncbi:hypothetical protein CYK57_00483 [Actinobacillus pleuropneumoniae]|nr:hypothetical protein CYK57_00483 [Actinobacillus pleuropneumoniae]